MSDTVPLDVLEAELPQNQQKKEEEDEIEPPPEPQSPWSTYLGNKWLPVLLNNNKLIYGFWIGFYYLAQFIGCVAVINLYSDVNRLTPCDTQGTLSSPEEATKVFDLPFLLLAIFHIIEWIRTTVLLTVICIGVKWLLFWYITVPNTLFGLVTYALVHVTYFGEDGKKCADAQPDRAAWLLGEIIAFWVIFFLFAFPFFWTMCKGKETADETLKENYEKKLDDDE